MSRRKVVPVLVALSGLLACKSLKTDVAAPEPDPFLHLEETPVLAPFDSSEDSSGAGSPGDNFGRHELPPIGDAELRSFQFRGTPLAAALRELADQAGISVYLDPRVEGTVDAGFVDVTQAAALRALCAHASLALEADEVGIFWIGPDDGQRPASASFQLQSIPAAQVSEQIQTLVQSGAVVAIDTDRNLVVVRGTRADVEAVEEYLATVDRLQQQVLLEVNLFEVRVDESFALGLAHQFQGTIDGNAVQILQALTGTENSFRVILDDEDGDLQSTLAALQRNAGVELLSSPKILVINNSEASIEVVEEIPYVSATSSQSSGDIGTSTLQQVEFKDVGVKLKVTPTIQQGGVMEISIDQTLSEVIDFFGGIPVVDTRDLKTKFLIENEKTVVFGGLMQDRRAAEDRGVPILMHIPLLGHLFKNNDDAAAKRELVVFLTARIVDPRQAAALSGAFQAHYRQKRGEYGRGPAQAGNG